MIGRLLKRMRSASATGALAEIELERRRLLELGYLQVLRPSRIDHGVDLCVWTEKGWIGIQVKTMQRVKKGGRGEKLRTVSRLDLSWAGRGKSYYSANGVQVFAVWTGRGFYVVPIDDVPHDKRMALDRSPWLWEAWTRGLGAPASVVYSSPLAQEREARQGALFIG